MSHPSDGGLESFDIFGVRVDEFGGEEVCPELGRRGLARSLRLVLDLKVWE
jgi:hypothetical protein